MISASNGSFTYDYTYDANGELLTKTKGNDVYKYYFDGVNLLFTKKNDSYNNRYIYADGAVFAAVGGAESFYWYATDVRKSSSSILKSDSTANHGVKRVRDFSYDAYGNTADTLQNTTDTEMDEIAYTGGVFDKELGLYYLMSRYYNPALAQFISEDSYRGDGEHFWNLYMYCEGDPINRTDRNGHISSYLQKKVDRAIKKSAFDKLLPKKRKFKYKVTTVHRTKYGNIRQVAVSTISKKPPTYTIYVYNGSKRALNEYSNQLFKTADKWALKKFFPAITAGTLFAQSLTTVAKSIMSAAAKSVLAATTGFASSAAIAYISIDCAVISDSYSSFGLYVKDKIMFKNGDITFAYSMTKLLARGIQYYNVNGKCTMTQGG